MSVVKGMTEDRWEFLKVIFDLPDNTVFRDHNSDGVLDLDSELFTVKAYEGCTCPKCRKFDRYESAGSDLKSKAEEKIRRLNVGNDFWKKYQPAVEAYAILRTGRCTERRLFDSAGKTDKEVEGEDSPRACSDEELTIAIINLGMTFIKGGCACVAEYADKLIQKYKDRPNVGGFLYQTAIAGYLDSNSLQRAKDLIDDYASYCVNCSDDIADLVSKVVQENYEKDKLDDAVAFLKRLPRNVMAARFDLQVPTENTGCEKDRRWADRLIKEFPYFADAYRARAVTDMQEICGQDLPSAEADIRKVLTLTRDIKLAAAYVKILGDILLHQGKADDALKAYEGALRMDPEQESFRPLVMASYYAVKGENEKVHSILKDLRKNTPRSPVLEQVQAIANLSDQCEQE